MGTHPKAPCVLADDSSITLADWLQRNADCVGTKVRKSFPDVGKLPFLFKVLSVNISLSIQAHPDKVRCVCDLYNIEKKYFDVLLCVCILCNYMKNCVFR